MKRDRKRAGERLGVGSGNDHESDSNPGPRGHSGPFMVRGCCLRHSSLLKGLFIYVIHPIHSSHISVTPHTNMLKISSFLYLCQRCHSQGYMNTHRRERRERHKGINTEHQKPTVTACAALSCLTAQGLCRVSSADAQPANANVYSMHTCPCV